MGAVRILHTEEFPQRNLAHKYQQFESSEKGLQKLRTICDLLQGYTDQKGRTLVESWESVQHFAKMYANDISERSTQSAYVRRAWEEFCEHCDIVDAHHTWNMIAKLIRALYVPTRSDSNRTFWNHFDQLRLEHSAEDFFQMIICIPQFWFHYMLRKAITDGRIIHDHMKRLCTYMGSVDIWMNPDNTMDVEATREEFKNWQRHTKAKAVKRKDIEAQQKRKQLFMDSQPISARPRLFIAPNGMRVNWWVWTDAKGDERVVRREGHRYNATEFDITITELLSMGFKQFE